MPVLRVVGATLAFLAIAHDARAQAQSAPGARDDNGWDIAPFIGVAQRSPVGRDWGIIADRRHLIVGIDLRAPVLRVGRVRAWYAPSVTPLLVLTHDRPAGSTEPQRPTAFGVGVSPFGVGVGVALTDRVGLFGASRIGILRFDREVPVPGASAVNVTLEWGAELEWRTRAGRRLAVGYRFHHLSNVYTALENPGVDGNVLTVGYGRRRRGARSR